MIFDVLSGRYIQTENDFKTLMTKVFNTDTAYLSIGEIIEPAPNRTVREYWEAIGLPDTNNPIGKMTPTMIVWSVDVDPIERHGFVEKLNIKI